MPEFISLLRKIRDVYYPQIRDIMDTISSDFETKRNEFSLFVEQKTSDFEELTRTKTNDFITLFNTSIEIIDAKKVDIVNYINEQRAAISSTISDFTTYASSLMTSLDTKKNELDTVATQLENIHIDEPVETLPPLNGVVANAEVEYNRLNGGIKFKIPAGRNGEDLAIDFVVANDTELYALTMDSANAKYVHTGSVAYREDTEMIYVKKDTGQNSSSVDWTSGAPLTPTTLFKNLSDTPAEIEPNKFYKGNLDGTALEQVTGKQVAEAQELQDIGNVQTTLTENAKKVVVVNDTEDGFEYSDDTPNALLLEGKTKQEVKDEAIITLRDSVPEDSNTLKKLNDKKSETLHRHDDIYYTEDEIDTALDSKANKNGENTENFQSRKISGIVSQGTDAEATYELGDVTLEQNQSGREYFRIKVTAEDHARIDDIVCREAVMLDDEIFTQWYIGSEQIAVVSQLGDFANEYGDSSKEFKVADATTENEAVSLRQLLALRDIATVDGCDSWTTDYKVHWAGALVSGSTLSATENGITIGESGKYKITAAQRSDGTGVPHIGIAVDGSRSALEGRANSLWSQDHAEGSNQFAHAIYIGELYSDELITMGAPDAYKDEFAYSSGGYAGYLIVERIS